jgi:alpha-tubulin suppressor-like RCC1 family protein
MMNKIRLIVLWLLAATLVACGGPQATIDSVKITTPTTMVSGSSQLVFAEVNGTGAFNKNITWTTTAGTLSKTTGSAVTLTAPDVLIASSLTLSASSTTDPSKSDSVVININPIPTNSSVTSVAASARNNTINAASQTIVNALVQGTNGFSNLINWSIVSGGGTLSAVTGTSLTYTAPITYSPSKTFIRASSDQDPSKSALLTININPLSANSSISNIELSASSNPVNASATTSITANIVGIGTFGDGLNWNIDSGVGSLDALTGSSVTFTAPSASDDSITVLRATSVQDPSKTATISLTINALIPPNSSVTDVSITATKIALREAETTNLTATLTGTGAFNSAVTWSIASGGVGTLSSIAKNTVVYNTALSVSFGRVVQILAVSKQDPSKKQSIFISINPIKASVSAGYAHSLALKTDGTVLSWGRDGSGQLGDDSTLANKVTPVAVADASNIVAVAAGGNHSLALKSDGTLLSWGLDNSGQLGDGPTNTGKATPTAVLDATNIVAIAAGGNHSLALKSDGTVLSWGQDDVGQLGNDSTLANQSAPVLVGGATSIVAIAAGDNHSLALKSDGTILSWGSDTSGELGNDSEFVSQSTPVAVSGASNIIAIAAGGAYCLALKSGGSLLSWGSDGKGQLGDDAASVNKSTPVSVNTEASNIVAIAAGDSHSLALKSGGTMLSWGWDGSGQLGDNTSSADKFMPVAVSQANNIVAVAAGQIHSLALKSDGTLLSWGLDDNGQLGDDLANANQFTPVAVLLDAFKIRLP